jgi:hypothetical protein
METGPPVGQPQECVGHSPASAEPCERSWGNEMSEMTIVQLVVAQRERELRALRRSGWWDCFELPCACLIGGCLMLLGIVAATAVMVLAPFRAPSTREADDTPRGD